jgi:hypothetical protein
MRRLFFIVLMLVAAGAAAAATFLPMHDNARWTYRNSTAQTMTITVLGQATIHGMSTIEMRWVLPDQTYRNYWTSDRNGNVYLNGAINEDGGFQAAYEPPIHWLPTAEASARCWSTASRMFPDLDGSSSAGTPLEIEFCIVGGGLVSTPAGVFETVAIGADTGIPSAKDVAGYDIFGRRIANAAKVSTTEWFSLDVGMVRNDEWELVSYEEITADEPLAWGAVKALYR